MMHLTIEELNKIEHEASMRLRRSRRSGNKKCRHFCCSSTSSPASRTNSPTEAQPGPDMSNPPPPGMSPEFWGFLALRRREPQDGSSKAVTAAVPEISPQLTVAVPEISPQQPSGTNHPSFSRDAVQLEQAADADVSTPKDTCTGRYSISEEHVTAQLSREIADAVRRWREATAEAKLVSPDTIAKVVHEAALKAADGIRMTHEKATPASPATEMTEAKTNEVIQLTEGIATVETPCVAPIENEANAPCVLPVTLSSNDSNKENIQMTCEEPDSEAEKEFWDSFPKEDNTSSQMVPIGDGNALVPAYLLKTINWNVHKIATRKLLQSVFGRRVLATHNLTGKVSPAFPDKMPKAKLDEALVNDIVQTVAERCNVTENTVRTCITIKCADEGKWLRKQLTKLKAKKKEDFEKKRTAEEKKLKINNLNLKT